MSPNPIPLEVVIERLERLEIKLNEDGFYVDANTAGLAVDELKGVQIAMMTEDDVIALLRRKVSEAGSAKAFAAAGVLSVPYLSDVLNGNRAPAGKILDALGLERVVTYRKKEKPRG